VSQEEKHTKSSVNNLEKCFRNTKPKRKPNHKQFNLLRQTFIIRNAQFYYARSEPRMETTNFHVRSIWLVLTDFISIQAFLGRTCDLDSIAEIARPPTAFSCETQSAMNGVVRYVNEIIIVVAGAWKGKQ
jgi:hypothetical protein